MSGRVGQDVRDVSLQHAVDVYDGRRVSQAVDIWEREAQEQGGSHS